MDFLQPILLQGKGKGPMGKREGLYERGKGCLHGGTRVVPYYQPTGHRGREGDADGGGAGGVGLCAGQLQQLDRGRGLERTGARGQTTVQPESATADPLGITFLQANVPA